MIEPIEQFGICWHCNNLMTMRSKEVGFNVHEFFEYILWKASCTAKNIPNIAQYPSSSADRFCQSEYWARIGESGKNFTFNINVCSKYEELI